MDEIKPVVNWRLRVRKKTRFLSINGIFPLPLYQKSDTKSETNHFSMKQSFADRRLAIETSMKELNRFLVLEKSFAT